MSPLPRSILVLSFTLLATVAGCGDADVPPTGETPTSYAFPSRYVDGQSSVAYSGQTLRQVLIADLVAYIGGLTATIDSNTDAFADGEVRAALEFYYDFDATIGGARALLLPTTPPPLQTQYGVISTSEKAGLVWKTAGNDAATDHKDWSMQFAGWTGATTPEGLLRTWFEAIDDLAAARSSNTIPKDPFGRDIAEAYVSATGLDYKQLVHKLLLGALAYSQATDDYLDDATAGKGILVANERDGTNPYTKLEHHWDEGFGYFGAARDYLDYSDDEIAGKDGRPEYRSGWHDTDGDTRIDLKSEINFGWSTNAAKRDRDSDVTAPTDHTKAIMESFLRGRAIISSADDALTDAQRAELTAQRDVIVTRWEEVLGATIIHYLNAVVRHHATFGDADLYDFEKHAKEWSEMKGFALALQFNPRSKIAGADFVRLHELLGDAPVLPGAADGAAPAYKDKLLEARTLVQDAYGFADANVGDANGENGW